MVKMKGGDEGRQQVEARREGKEEGEKERVVEGKVNRR